MSHIPIAASTAKIRGWLTESFARAVAAADPKKIVQAYLPEPATLHPNGRLRVVGAGKAAAAMAVAVEQAYASSIPLTGLVITRYAHSLPTRAIRVVEAGHPVPDGAGAQAAADIYALVTGLQAHDHLLVLVSGGGSSLLALPVDKVSMADMQAVTQALLRSGAPITEMNVVRKHLSRMQGGWMAALAAERGAQVTALMISDVAGDDLSTIASGPTVPDPSTYADALAILLRYQIQIPHAVAEHLQAGIDGWVPETPKVNHPCFAQVRNHLIATAQGSLLAAQQYLEDAGFQVLNLGDALEGEAQEVAQAHAALVVQQRQSMPRPLAILSGGECTVTLPQDLLGKPRGGRCSEYLLALGLALQSLGGSENVYALAADTDGIDGSEDNAGALLWPDSLARAAQQGVSAAQALAQHDAYGFFATLDDLIVTGPTRTNVNDFRVILLL